MAFLALAPVGAVASPQAIEALAAQLPDADAAQVSALAADHLAAPLDQNYEAAWWHLTFYRWCETDAEAAGAFALAQDDRQLLHAFIQAARAQQPETAEALAASLGESAKQAHASIESTEQFHQPAVPMSDAEFSSEIARIFGESSGRRDRATKLQGLIRALTASQPEEMFAQINAVAADGEERYLLLEAFTKSLGGADPEAAARIYGQLPAWTARSKLAAELANKWASDNPGAARAWAASLPTGPERDAALTAVVAEMADDNPLAVFELLDQHGWQMDFQPSAQFSRVVAPGNSVVGGGGSTSPFNMPYVLEKAISALVTEGRVSEALGRLTQIPDAGAQDQAVSSMMKAWIEQDAAAATRWLAASGSTEHNPSVSQHLRAGIQRLLAGDDPSAALEVLGQISNEDTLKDTLKNVLRNVANSSTRAVTGTRAVLLEWAKAQGEDGPGLRAAIGQGLAHSDPAAAAEVLFNLPSNADTSSAWSTVAHHWSQSDPAAAATFFFQGGEAFPSPLLMSVVSGWLRSSPEAASTWVAQLPQGESRDVAVGALVDHLSRGSPALHDFEAALIWSGEIADPALAEMKIESVLRERQRADPAPAPTR